MRAAANSAVANRPGERLVLVDTSSWIHFLRADGDALEHADEDFERVSSVVST